MKVIYKYPLMLTDRQKIDMPEGARPLSAQWQGRKNVLWGQAVLWALVDTDAMTRPVDVRIIGTGNQMPADMRSHTYVGTVQEPDEPLVWHVFVGPTQMTGV